MLDIGTATGHPLHSIIDTFKDAQVVGIDIDQNYIPAAEKLFQNHKNVTIKLLNFYEMDHAFPELSFDTIIFGSSFMLMPDQVKAIEIAKSTSLSQHRSPIKGWKDLLPPHPLRSEIKLQPVYVKNQAVPQIHLNS